MFDACDQLGLGLEAARKPFDSDKAGMDEFDGDVAVQRRLVGSVDNAEATLADLLPQLEVVDSHGATLGGEVETARGETDRSAHRSRFVQTNNQVAGLADRAVGKRVEGPGPPILDPLRRVADDAGDEGFDLGLFLIAE